MSAKMKRLISVVTLLLAVVLSACGGAGSDTGPSTDASPDVRAQ